MSYSVANRSSRSGAKFGSGAKTHPKVNADEFKSTLPQSELSEIDKMVDSYVDVYAGGPVWKDVLARENAIWKGILANSNDRVDKTNPVGGLIDVTDMVKSIRSKF